jgi:hypothetical protein
VNYKMLMVFYNQNILEKDETVSFGNAMSIMRKKGIILPPVPKQSQTVVFSREKVAEFLQTNGCMCIIFRILGLQKYYFFLNF